MGTYTYLTISGYPLISSKSAVIPAVMTIFREGDKKIARKRASQRNPLVWGVFDGEVDDDEVVITYERRVKDVSERLDVMGFTLAQCRGEFEELRAGLLEEYQSYGDSDLYSQEASVIQVLSFERYVEVVRKIVTTGMMDYDYYDREAQKKLDPEVRFVLCDEEVIFGFPWRDVRTIIRLVCSLSTDESMVVQDISNLVDGGFYGSEELVCENAVRSLTEGHPENSTRIILTEGVSDAMILGEAMRVLFPHLAEYYTFMDFSAFRAQGGAANLVGLIKAFAAAGISNRIIALFDNDTAARDALRSLQNIKLPKNIAVLTYPDLELLQKYPTLGPSGLMDLNVNGLAASVELYLGRDVLTAADGRLRPVQWKGYIDGMKSYQGEVMGKAEIQDAFFKKAKHINTNEALSSDEWGDLERLLRKIFTAFP